MTHLFHAALYLVPLALLAGSALGASAQEASSKALPSPTECMYAPPGEYVKDHSFVYADGWWHFFSISGTAGHSHRAPGNEETFSWSVSKDLVNWTFRGHVVHASLWEGFFDRDEVWAPFVMKSEDGFYMFYTGVAHPYRIMAYEKLGADYPMDWREHVTTQGLAYSEDLARWTKIADQQEGLGVPGRDSHVVRDEDGGRWLLYTTGPRTETYSVAYVSQSTDLRNWEFLGEAARFPNYTDIVATTTESLYVMKHPLNGKWIMMGNKFYVLSEDPTEFPEDDVREYKRSTGGVGEIIHWQGTWYRSGAAGPADRWKLGFSQIEWDADGAFTVVKLSKPLRQQWGRADG